jgi:hypothetical protein
MLQQLKSMSSPLSPGGNQSIRKYKDLPPQDDLGNVNPTTIQLMNPRPVISTHTHEETFFELFYDLIIVVVLMKLSYLKV